MCIGSVNSLWGSLSGNFALCLLLFGDIPVHNVKCGVYFMIVELF
jgi:hypothetical protein